MKTTLKRAASLAIVLLLALTPAISLPVSASQASSLTSSAPAFLPINNSGGGTYDYHGKLNASYMNEFDNYERGLSDSCPNLSSLNFRRSPPGTLVNLFGDEGVSGFSGYFWTNEDNYIGHNPRWEIKTLWTKDVDHNRHYDYLVNGKRVESGTGKKACETYLG